MSFEEALRLLISSHGLDILNDKFRTHSIMSDYIGNELESYKLTKIFVKIFDYSALSNIKSINNVDELKKSFTMHYKANVSKCSIQEYKTIVEGILRVFGKENALKMISTGNPKIIKKVIINKARRTKLIVNNPIIKPNTPLNNTPSPVNNTPVVKKAPKVKHIVRNNPNNLNKFALPKLKLHNLLGLSILANNVYMAIEYSSNDEFQIFKDAGKAKATPQKVELDQGILYLDLRNYQAKKFLIKVPKTIYTEITIKGHHLNLHVGVDVNNPIKVNTLDIDTFSSDIETICECDRIHVHNMDGNIKIASHIKEVNIFNTNGNIEYLLTIGKFRKETIRIVSLNGKIKGRFTEGNILPINKLIATNNHLYFTQKANNCNIGIFINSDSNNIDIG